MIRKVATTVDSISRQYGLNFTKYFLIHNRRVYTLMYFVFIPDFSNVGHIRQQPVKGRLTKRLTTEFVSFPRCPQLVLPTTLLQFLTDTLQGLMQKIQIKDNLHL